MRTIMSVHNDIIPLSLITVDTVIDGKANIRLGLPKLEYTNIII